MVRYFEFWNKWYRVPEGIASSHTEIKGTPLERVGSANAWRRERLDESRNVEKLTRKPPELNWTMDLPGSGCRGAFPQDPHQQPTGFNGEMLPILGM